MHDLDGWETANTPQVLMVPGLDNSGPDHWQSIWQRETSWFDRADMGLWERPVRNVWVTKLNQAIRQTRAPVILCAHSLGCLAVAWWAALEGQVYGWPVAGALLVAPPDVDGPDNNPRLASFGPAPKIILPFPTVVVASRDDPFASFEQSRRLAGLWGAEFVDAGEAGHINAESDLGNWSEGRSLLDALIDGHTPPRQPVERLARQPRAPSCAAPSFAESRVLGFNYDTGERYLSVPDFLPLEEPIEREAPLIAA